MRPIYETPEHAQAEEIFRHALLAPLRCDAILKTKQFYPIDGIANRGPITVAFVEIKVRTNPMAQYPTYMLSLEKYVKGVSFALACNADFIIAVKWTDTAGLWSYLNHRHNFPRVAIGGRTDRNDAQDLEPVIHIPIREFKTL